MTIQSYVKQQGELLQAEAEMGAKAREDRQRMDARVRDTYTQLVRRSVYDLGTTQLGSDDGASGIRIQPPPRSSGVWDYSTPKEDLKHRRDVTLLENGMIKERVDVKREEREEEKRRRKEERRTRKQSGTEASFLNSPSQYFTSPVMPSSYDPDPNYAATVTGASPRHLLPQQHPSMSSPSLGSPNPRPFSMVMSSSMSRAVNQSQVSVDARSTRFFGVKNWTTAWGSGTSVAPSGSVMDMQYVHSVPNLRDNTDYLFANSLALDQERRQQQNLETLSQFDLPSSFSVPNSPRQARPRTADATLPFGARSLSPDSAKGKKKKRGLGKLWRVLRGSKDEGRGIPNGYTHEKPAQLRQEEDFSEPLVPPPSLVYLANQRGGGGGQQRQVSTASLSGNHPRSASQPNPGTVSNGATSPTTAPSSSLPSPTWRDSGSDDRKSMIQKDGYDQVLAMQVDGIGLYDLGMLRQSQVLHATDDPKRTLQVPSSGTPTPTGVFNSPTSPIGASSRPSTTMANHKQQRPLSAMIHKNLPPIPPGETPVPNPAVPMSSASLPPNFGTPEPDMAFLPSGTQSSQNFGMPNSPFRVPAHDGRRQSFGGVIARPVVQLDSPPLAAQTMQPQRAYQQNGNGMTYDEMGYMHNGSMKSQRSSPQLRPTTSPSTAKSEKSHKRRSRFGLSALLGKKDKDRDHASSKHSDFSPQERLTPSVYSQPHSSADYEYQTMRNPSSDGMGYTNGLTAPVKSFNQTRGVGSSSSLVMVDPEAVMGRPPSMFISSPSGENVPRSLGTTGRQPSHASSMTSKRVEDLVARDDDFVAYRYPSTDQQLDLPRR